MSIAWWKKVEKTLEGPAAGGWALVIVAGLVGMLAGAVAVAFDFLVGLSESFFFGGIAHHEFVGWKLLLLIPLPALGGLAVGLVTHYVARSQPGHGIPDVIEALVHGQALRTRTGLFKMATASLTIGSGGSAGQEGPIVQIGAVVGSAVSRRLDVSREHRNTLVGCGAAAGLAALFNAPIAGVMFVLEVMLRDFSMRTFMPVVVAGVMGVATAGALHGGSEIAIFSVPATLHDYPFTLKKLVPFLLLGGLCGLGGYAFTWVFHRMDHFWHGLKVHPVLKPMLGGLLLGLLGVVFVLSFGRGGGGYEPPVFFANGYPVIQWLFHPSTYISTFNEDGMTPETVRQVTFLFLVAAMGCKIIGTALTLGSGGSGGTFAPSLFIGATLGAAWGMVVRAVPGFSDIMPANFALVGMAGVLAAAVHCPLTSFLLVFELTNDYKLILPAMLVAVLATTIAKLLMRDSIYTLTLREHGIRVGTQSDLTILRRLSLTQEMLKPAAAIGPADPVQRVVDLAVDQGTADFVVVDDKGQYVGAVLAEDLRTALLQRESIPLLIVEELMRKDVPTLHLGDTLELALDRFTREDMTSLPVLGNDKQVLGMVTRAGIMRAYMKSLDDE